MSSVCAVGNLGQVLWCTGSLPGAAGDAGQATGRGTAARMEDRLTALEADLSHSTAANEAMSGIIDQVHPSPCLSALQTL